ncbi:MAG: CBS domain-containing protein, partial [Flavobacteriaceae bacterium]
GKKGEGRGEERARKKRKKEGEMEKKGKKGSGEISEKMLGATAVMQGGDIKGIVTDGDIRRMLNNYENINGLTAKDIMTTNPKTVEASVLAVKALKEMRSKGISQLLVVEEGKYIGVVHLHNLIKEGIM